jgi:hypothetical protein
MSQLDLPKSWNENAPLVMATNYCIGPNRHKVRFIVREEPNNPYDSGWIFFTGTEPDGHIDDPENMVICPLLRFLEIEPSLIELLSSPVGSMWEKKTDDGGWLKVENYDVHE